VAMQRILVDHARRRRAAKRSSRDRTLAFTYEEPVQAADPDVILDIDEALVRLALEDSSSAEVARLRLFGGLAIEEAAEAMGISRATAFREWAYARAWLATALTSTQ
jgi:RNA polymerase sigma factor (TIGR02999 family)